MFFIRLCFFIFVTFNSQAGGLLANLSYGVELNNQSVTFESDVSGSPVKQTESASGFSVFTQKYYRQKYRFSGSIGMNAYTSNTLMNMRLGADYIYPLDSGTALIMGLSVGGATQKFNGSRVSEAAYALVYGAQAGAVIFINHNLSLTLGYRLRQTNLETQVSGSNALITTTDLNEMYLGALVSF